MARTCFRGRRKPGPRHVRVCVAEFFDWLESGYQAGDFREYLPLIFDWDSSGEWPESSQYYRAGAWDGNHAQSVGGFVSAMDEQWIPHYWSVNDRDDYEDIRERWCGGATACIRAGLDVACAPSMGVIGFTAGDLRRMYPKGVPEWVKEFFHDGEAVTAAKVIPGVGFAPEVVGPCETFDDMPDDAELRL